MLDVFVLARTTPAAVAQSLAALVPAVVLGHISRVTIFSGSDDPDLRRLADEAGCDMLIGRDAAEELALLRGARPSWWLVMQGGQVPLDAWSDRVARHMAFSSGIAVILPARGIPRVAAARMAAMVGQTSTQHHMLVVPPGRALTGRGNQLGSFIRPTLLRTGFESALQSV